MSKLLMLGAARAPSARNWRLLAPLVVLAGLSAALGCWSLWIHEHDSSRDWLRAPAGLLLIVAALLQLRVIQHAWRRGGQVSRVSYCRRTLLRWLFVGLVLSYAIALVVGPEPGTPFAFAALLVAWYTLVVWLTANPNVLRQWRELAHAPRPRRIGIVVYAMLLVVVGVESAGQLYVWLSGDESHWAANPTIALANEPEVRPSDKFAPPRPGIFRVAVLGDAGLAHKTTSQTISQGNCLAQIETLVPGMEVFNFAAPQKGSRQFTTALLDRVMACQPDLVLTFISVGEDLTSDAPTPNVFDWRVLWTARPLARAQQKRVAGPLPCDPTDDQSSFLQAYSPQLAVCRTPLDDTMRRRWKRAFVHLDKVVERCRARDTAVALVVVPGQFQVNQVLCDMLRRRQGYEPQELDLELPQRRLAVFSEDRKLPILDLLPYLRRCDEPIYARNTARWNERGNDLAAHAIGGWLQSRYGSAISAQLK